MHIPGLLILTILAIGSFATSCQLWDQKLKIMNCQWGVCGRYSYEIGSKWDDGGILKATTQNHAIDAQCKIRNSAQYQPNLPNTPSDSCCDAYGWWGCLYGWSNLWCYPEKNEKNEKDEKKDTSNGGLLG